MRVIKVLVVDDSLVFRELLTQSLNEDTKIQVVATAKDPYEARDAIIAFQPDVMTLDIELPKMNGIEFLQKLMPQYPLPVVVISALSDKVFEAMSAGAVDFVAKPTTINKTEIKHFIKKYIVSQVKIAVTAQVGISKPKIVQSLEKKESISNPNLMVAIGASTGGTEAIASVIKEFDIDIPGVVIVQHMPEGFTKMYADRLNGQCRVHVKEAKTGDVIQQGHVLIAPGGDAHMEVVKVNNQYQVVCKRGPKVNGHCPSADVLFRSVANTVGKNAVGIILTGMGGDGAQGLLAMKQAGARTIGQDKSSCIVYGMPKIAYEIGAVEYQEKLIDIPKRIYQVLSRM